MKVTRLESTEIEERLVNLNSNGPFEWKLDGDGIAMKTTFDNFVSAFAFMTKVAMFAERLDHHPEWFNVYNKLEVRLSTHSAGGISELDFKLAERMAEVY